MDRSGRLDAMWMLDEIMTCRNIVVRPGVAILKH